MPGQRDDSDEVLTMVCLTCGEEYYFTGGRPEGAVTCEKCGGSVFREFDTAAPDNEAAADFTDSTARDLDPDDAEGDAMPGDALDLNP